MAKVLGNAGRYVSQESAKKFQGLVVVAFAGIGLISFLFGVFSVYDLFIKKSQLDLIFSVVAFLLLMFLIVRLLNRRMDAHEQDRRNFLKGATGEQAVARKINDLPDDYCVIHDLATPFGNLDHVVIGPTGVFIIETKNWRGIITADGRGDILHNNAPTRKPTVKPLVARMMNVRDKVKVLLDAKDDLPYFNAVLVFPSAWVAAKWGQTGSARCITDDQTWGYVVEFNCERKLTARQIEGLSLALRALATMDKEFPNDIAPERTKPAIIGAS